MAIKFLFIYVSGNVYNLCHNILYNFKGFQIMSNVFGHL